jgi:polysaccharide biosynthesis/export protein
MELTLNVSGLLRRRGTAPCALLAVAVLWAAQTAGAQTKSPPDQAGGPPPPAANGSEPAESKTEPPPARKADAAPGTAVAADDSKRYVIGSLDVLYIRVWNNPNLSGPVDVRPDGMMSLPLIGEVKADGLTPEQLKTTLKTRLNDFLNSPEVDVQVTKVNSKRYFINGEVLRTGPFPLVEATTVLDALSNAGGFKDFANTKKIYILRGKEKFNFNYKDVSKGKNMEQNILLQNGDRIFVP